MTPWGRATTALRLLQVDPAGLGGILLQARSGTVRDAFLALLPRTIVKLHPAMPRDTLTGGIDVAGSLGTGTVVRQRGLLDTSGAQWVLGMAERTPALMAGALAAALDARRGNTLIALDEHAEDEESLTPILSDRLAFHVSLDGMSLRDLGGPTPPTTDPLSPDRITVPDGMAEDIVNLAVTLGITSLRAATLTLAAAKAHAALNRRKAVSVDDLAVAAELVLAPRATRLPQQPEDTPEEPEHPPEDQSGDENNAAQDDLIFPDDILLAAIKSALPPDILSNAGSNRGKNSAGSGAGQRRIGNRRGRPLPPRDSGNGGQDARVDLVATLRAAIPWQRLRRAAQPDRTGPIIHPGDLRYKRFEDLSDRLLIFAVDASGSAALARLAEAKGAVELLLAEAYARRDHVSLISFRGDRAEELLPPTRSLVQTKRRLAELPGGGGTPLASGLLTGLETALAAMRKGLSPVLIVLTDGRSNVALDGTPSRAQAAEDVQSVAGQIALAGIDTITIDTGRRPEKALRDLALSLRGQYVSLPRADAQSLSQSISTALER